MKPKPHAAVAAVIQFLCFAAAYRQAAPNPVVANAGRRKSQVYEIKELMYRDNVCIIRRAGKGINTPVIRTATTLYSDEHLGGKDIVETLC